MGADSTEIVSSFGSLSQRTDAEDNPGSSLGSGILRVDSGAGHVDLAARAADTFTMRQAMMRSGLASLLAFALFPVAVRAQAPVFATTPEESTVNFYVKASVALTGKFERWDASLKFNSADVTSGVLDIKIDAATVNTGSGMKDGKLRSKDFFDVKENPSITFRSTGVTQTGPVTFDIPGTFTIRGVSKPETLKLTISGKGTRAGEIKGKMAFDRKDYGMTSGIPFVKIADRVEVEVDLKVKQVSGPSLVYKQ